MAGGLDLSFLAAPFMVVVVLWFISTGLVAMIHHRMRQSFGRAMLIAGACGFTGLALIVCTSEHTNIWAAYASCIGGLLVWSWHEISFLTGAVAGSHRDVCPPDVTKWDRFARATAALIHHEIALAMTAILLLSLAAVTANATGAYIFALLLLFRLSSKLNIYWGVPNLNDELLPRHLEYLKSYFGPKILRPMLPISIIAIFALGGYFAQSALLANHGFLTVQASLLCTLCILAAVEHVFLAIPFRDSALWSWALSTDTQSPQTKIAETQ